MPLLKLWITGEEEKMEEDRGLNLWNKVLEKISPKIDRQSYEVWIKPIKFSSFNNKILSLEVPSKFFQDWFTTHYLDLVQKAMEEFSGGGVKVKFLISPQRERSLRKEKVIIKEFIEGDMDAGYSSQLNPKYTFESFVVGPSNRFAHAASLAVAQSPAKSYNPLFIYGGVGLGKTHLMQAIGRYILNKNSQSKVFYISSERFTNDLISAIRNRTTTRFRRKYRNVDVLLIDDIHFIAGKESTQVEFFHTFNELYDAHKQIVISSDRPPKEIPTLEERLASRFEWGLVTDIAPPDFETRLAILQNKAEINHYKVPNDVLEFIAENIKYNIRELEGALIRIVAFASLVGSEVNITLAREVLKEIAPVKAERQIDIEQVQRIVVDYFRLKISDMRVKKRSRNIAFPRQIAMYLCREITDCSLIEIGDRFGGRDHTTVMHAWEKINKLKEKDNEVKEVIEHLLRLIKEESLR